MENSQNRTFSTVWLGGVAALRSGASEAPRRVMHFRRSGIQKHFGRSMVRRNNFQTVLGGKRQHFLDLRGINGRRIVF